MTDPVSVEDGAPVGRLRAVRLADEDLEEIHQLLARYSQTLDFGDAEGFASCFVEDGVLDTSAPEEGLAGAHRGREELRRFATASTQYTGGRVRQSALNVLVEGDGETARATSYVIVTRAYDEATSAHGKPSQVTQSDWETTGMYFDEFVRVDGRWLFLRRQFRHDGLPDVLQRANAAVTIGPTAGLLTSDASEP